jgi:Domain of unknown function (DUF4157)
MKPKVFDLEADAAAVPFPAPAPSAPGRSTLTSRLPGRPTMILRVESAEAARELAHAWGPRDPNGVAAGAGAAIDRAASSSTGAPLPDDVRSRFEGSLGADLSAVRVHTGATSADAAHAVGAHAYTVGQDIHFADGRYAPGDPFGLHLLAHEVAHTVQQRGESAPAPQCKLEVSSPGDAAEREADRAADAMVAGAPFAVPGAPPAIARDVDGDMVKAGNDAANANSNDVRVQVVMGHTTSADEMEAKEILKKIRAAEKPLAERTVRRWRSDHDGDLGPMKSMLVENRDAEFVLEQYLATVSDSGNYQSEYAASYATTKRDYGKFMGLFQAFEAAGGKLAHDSQKAKLASLSNDPEFLRARQKFEEVRDHLATDRNKVQEDQTKADSAKAGLMSAVYAMGATAARATAKTKQAELDALKQSINDAVSTIMMIGQIAAVATTGALTFGSSDSGFNMEKLVESSPEIAAPGTPAPPPAAGTPPPPPSLAPPDIRKFTVPGSDLHPQAGSPEDGLPGAKINDTRTYAMPSQTVATAKDLGSKGVAALGGPKEMLTKAITMMEEAKIDKIQAQIDAANEEGNLKEAAAQVAAMKKARTEYLARIETLSNNVRNLIDHKSQLNTHMNAMVSAAKRKGADKDLTGSIRLLGAGDQFLSQIDHTIRLGDKQQETGREAKVRRNNINAGPYSGGSAQGPGQLFYWSIDGKKEKGVWVATKHHVELKATGKDSLEGGVANSTQFDVGKSLDELKRWKEVVREKRDLAQGSLGIGKAAGHSSD